MNNKDKFFLSHSKRECADKCWKQFKYVYVDKLKIEDEDDDPSAANFGNCIHEIAENYKGGGKEELLKLYHEYVPSKYTFNYFYKNKLGLALKNLHNYYMNNLKDVEYTPEQTVFSDYNDDIVLNGKIDVLYEKDGRYKIVDYKTKKTYKWYDPKDQLCMYALLLHNKFKIPYSKMDFEIVYLSLEKEDKYGNITLNEGLENIQKEYNISEEDIECQKKDIKVLYKKYNRYMETGKWPSNPTKFNCTYCKFKTICDEKYIED